LVRPDLAAQAEARADARARHDRRPLTGGVPGRHRAQRRRLVPGLRREGGAEALPGARSPRPDLVGQARAGTARGARPHGCGPPPWRTTSCCVHGAERNLTLHNRGASRHPGKGEVEMKKLLAMAIALGLPMAAIAQQSSAPAPKPTAAKTETSKSTETK